MKKEGKFVSKGWGYEFWIVNKEEYCGKILFFKKDKKCSWHYHRLKDETFFIQSGKLKLIYSYGDDKSKATEVILEKGDIFHITVGLRHQMTAIMDTEMFEFSTEHFDEDSIRVERGD